MRQRKQLTVVTFVYWFLLVYVVAALVFWFTALENQNRQMISYKLSELSTRDADFQKKRSALLKEKSSKTIQYIGEGITFLAIILIGAVFVYRAVRKQITLQHQQQNFMMAITHELKTPIAVAKLNLETLQKHQLDDVKRQKLIQMTLEETNRLNNLASNILVSSQLEAQKYRMAKEEIGFSDLVQSSISDFMSRFPNRKWENDIDPETEIQGDPLLLQTMVNNLLDNAVKYSPAGSVIRCSLKGKGGSTLLEISDQGNGIPESERRQIFEKFYRIGNEQTRTTRGTGLGLYLVKKIAKDHGGDIRVSDNTPAGSIFTVTFGRH